MGKKRRITIEGLLRLIDDVHEAYFDLSRRAVYKRIYNPKEINIEDYFPSEVEVKLGTLQRKGLVKKTETEEGIQVELTESGRKQVLMYKLGELKPILGNWDGKWRLVFFDVEERERKKRKSLVGYLMKLGMKEMQESVYVGPYDCEKEVKYIREVLGVPHGVKLAIVEKIENEEELKGWFELK